MRLSYPLQGKDQPRENGVVLQQRGRLGPILLSNEGFTVIELMIVTVIVGILAAIALPNFIAYRDRARAIAAITSGARGALAAAAADDRDSLYPEDTKVTKASDLNRYGTNLSDNTYESFTYKQLDGGKSYQIDIVTLGGSTICVRPEMVEQKKCL
jgi:prepilin-type N-terminal cleavage/methylation domain-containing protein